MSMRNVCERVARRRRDNEFAAEPPRKVEVAAEAYRLELANSLLWCSVVRNTQRPGRSAEEEIRGVSYGDRVFSALETMRRGIIRNLLRTGRHVTGAPNLFECCPSGLRGGIEVPRLGDEPALMRLTPPQVGLSTRGKNPLEPDVANAHGEREDEFTTRASAVRARRKPACCYDGSFGPRASLNRASPRQADLATEKSQPDEGDSRQRPP